jgi:hypothetical protein
VVDEHEAVGQVFDTACLAIFKVIVPVPDAYRLGGVVMFVCLRFISLV